MNSNTKVYDKTPDGFYEKVEDVNVDGKIEIIFETARSYVTKKILVIY